MRSRLSFRTRAGPATGHDAMLPAEGGADYVLFGEPDQAGHRPSPEAVTERVTWWAEIFEPPCVGYAATLAEVGALAAAGADFVAVGDCIFEDSRGPAAALAEAAQSLRQPGAGGGRSARGQAAAALRAPSRPAAPVAPAAAQAPVPLAPPATQTPPQS